MKIPQALINKRENIANDTALIIGLPTGDTRLNLIALLLNHSLEGYFYPNDLEINPNHSTIYDKADRYGRRKLLLDSNIVKKFPDFWNDIGLNSKEIVIYLEFGEDFLSQVFKICSYPALLKIPSYKPRFQSIINRYKKTPNLLGIYLDIQHNKFYVIGEVNILKRTFDLVLNHCNWSLSPM